MNPETEHLAQMPARVRRISDERGDKRCSIVSRETDDSPVQKPPRFACCPIHQTGVDPRNKLLVPLPTRTPSPTRRRELLATAHGCLAVTRRGHRRNHIH